MLARASEAVAAGGAAVHDVDRLLERWYAWECLGEDNHFATKGVPCTSALALVGCQMRSATLALSRYCSCRPAVCRRDDIIFIVPNRGDAAIASLKSMLEWQSFMQLNNRCLARH